MASAEVALPTRPENITFVRSRLLTKEVPTNAFERYLHPAATKVSSLEGKSESTLPLVDLAGLRTGDSAAREEIVRQLGKAATEWGFFQIINHGISEEKLNELQQRTREFFELPVDVKERGEDPTEMFYGYNGRFCHRNKETPWLESLSQFYRPNPDVESLVKKIWPDGNPTFCNLVNEWVLAAESLSLLLLELLAESLGLKADTFSKHLKDIENNKTAYRLHRYPSCPYPSSCFGAAAHSDTGTLTIVKQDAVCGLQVREGERFIDVKPIPGAFVVNVGDQLEVWTNGRFKSCEHRVVVNGQTDRYSLVYLLLAGPKDFVIQCPPELIDEDHPSLYIPYTYTDYRANYESMLRERGRLGRKATLEFALRKTQEGQDNTL